LELASKIALITWPVAVSCMKVEQRRERMDQPDVGAEREHFVIA
jgi:hypothetical protein